MISIITVTYNSRPEIERFLLSLSAMLKELPLDAETRIWDNASSDGTREYLRSLERHFEAVKMKVNFSPRNVGLSKAVNSEIAQSEGEWVLLCNPDIEFSSEVAKLFEFGSSHPECGITSDLKNPDGTQQRSIHRRFPSFARIFFEHTSLGVYFSRLFPFIRNDYKYTYCQFTHPTFIEQPGGSFLLFHRRTVDKLSDQAMLFDEKFPVFWNDVDMAMTARKRDVKFVMLPQVRIQHGFGHSVKKVNREMILTLFFGSHGMIGFARKWKMHPRAIQIILFLDSIFAVSLGFLAHFSRHGEGGAKGQGRLTAMLRWRIMKFWCSLH
jgi:N-acetylglucosaminyl-diphospho-decaprenol L-rhamnosyltransferase